MPPYSEYNTEYKRPFIAGSLSTGNLELSAHNHHQTKICRGSAHGTSNKPQPTNSRYSIFSSGNAQNTTPDRLSVQPKSKGSFLSRITSRPSLSARYSSADLKTVKSKSPFRTPEKPRESEMRRPEFMHSLENTKSNALGEDRDFFISPRVAPTPPNLNFTSSASSILDSPVHSQSSINLPSLKSNLSLQMNAIESPTARKVKSPTSSAMGGKPRGPQTLSPEMAYNAPRRNSIQIDSPISTLSVKSAHSPALSFSTTSPARPRTGMVRIGKENVTVSVANVLEAELGIEIGDSEDSSISYYEDSFEGNTKPPKQELKQNNAKQYKRDTVISASLQRSFPNKSCIDPQAYKSPNVSGNSESKLILEAQSFLLNPETDKRKVIEERSRSPGVIKNTGNQGSQYLNPAPNRIVLKSKPSYSSTQFREVDCMDRISERSVPTNYGSPSLSEGKRKLECSPEVTAQLQQSLDIQCARFDKLAGHLLQIIQRHQNEKVQLETRISGLEKENRRCEREIKALRRLLNLSAQDARSGRGRLVRVASMQSFLSNNSFQDRDEEVDIAAAAEMLSRASRKNCDTNISPEVTKDIRASVDLSPSCTPNKDKTGTSEQLRRSKTMPDLHKVSINSSVVHELANLPGSSSIPTIPSAESPLLSDTSPDVSGHGLGLDFPLPAPIKLPSISSTIISSAAASNLSVPALTTAPTATSGLSAISIPSLELKKSVDSFAALAATVPQINEDVIQQAFDTAPTGSDEEINVKAPLRRGTIATSNGTSARSPAKNSRDKRKAGEWRQGSIGVVAGGGLLSDSRGYRSVESLAVKPPPLGAPPTCQIPELPTSMLASASYAANLNKGLVSSIDRVVVFEESMMKMKSPDLKNLYRVGAAKSSERF